VREQITRRANGMCEICFFYAAEHIHHRRPRGAGGSKAPDTNTAANGIALCTECHTWVESNRTKALEVGWLVRQGHDPASVPMVRFGSDWVLLNDDGTTTAYKGGT
jgi:hypothetical protein